MICAGWELVCYVKHVSLATKNYGDLTSTSLFTLLRFWKKLVKKSRGNLPTCRRDLIPDVSVIGEADADEADQCDGSRTKWPFF